MTSKFGEIRKLGFIIVACIMVLMLLVAGIGELLDSEGRPDVEKLDLSNFSLENLTDNQIVCIESQYSAYRYKSSKNGNETGIDNQRYEAYDRDQLSFSAKKITGIHPLIATKVSDGNLHIKIESSLNSGEMKIVVIRDDKILEYLEVGKVVELNYYADGEHTYYIKLLGKDANMSITVSREIQQA